MSVSTSENVLGYGFITSLLYSLAIGVRRHHRTRTVRVGGGAPGKILVVNEAAAVCFVNQTKPF